MASAGVDHMVSLTIFIAAILIFIGLFSQNIQTAVVYEQHQALSTKASDLLDSLLLTPGVPANWGTSDTAPTCFGLQDPEYPQYKLSTFSLMRLNSSTPQVNYQRTGEDYTNLSAGYGGYLMAPTSKTLSYSDVSKLLGVNGTYGFQMTLTPLLSVSATKISSGIPLTFSVRIEGTGFPLANTSITYSLIMVNQDSNQYPSFTMTSGTRVTDGTGGVQVSFPGVNGESNAYAFIVYTYLYGLKGMGYYVHETPSMTKSIIPLVDSFQNGNILLAHDDSVGPAPQPAQYSQLSYNASFGILTDEYTLRQVALNPATATGKVTYDSQTLPSFATVTVPNNDGILIVTYKDESGNYGINLMPWGLGSMAFPLTFGADHSGQEWVSTDIREVTIGGFAYQVQLAAWNMQGISRTG